MVLNLTIFRGIYNLALIKASSWNVTIWTNPNFCSISPQITLVEFLGLLPASIRRSLHAGDEPHCTATMLHIFDSKKCSEASSQPKVRPPPLRESRLALIWYILDMHMFQHGFNFPAWPFCATHISGWSFAKGPISHRVPRLIHNYLFVSQSVWQSGSSSEIPTALHIFLSWGKNEDLGVATQTCWFYFITPSKEGPLHWQLWWSPCFQPMWHCHDQWWWPWRTALAVDGEMQISTNLTKPFMIIYVPASNVHVQPCRTQSSPHYIQEGWCFHPTLWKAAHRCLWWRVHHGEAGAHAGEFIMFQALTGYHALHLKTNKNMLWEAWQEAKLCSQAVWDGARPHATKWPEGSQEKEASLHVLSLAIELGINHNNQPMMHLVNPTPPHSNQALRLLARLHYNGTNRGDTIYGVKFPSYDSPAVWKLKFGDKKLMYGKHRMAVGGAAPEGSEGEPSGKGWSSWKLMKPVLIPSTLCSDKCITTQPSLLCRTPAWQCRGTGILPCRATGPGWGNCALLLRGWHQWSNTRHELPPGWIYYFNVKYISLLLLSATVRNPWQTIVKCMVPDFNFAKTLLANPQSLKLEPLF